MPRELIACAFVVYMKNETGFVLASLGVLSWRNEHGLTRGQLWPVPLLIVGIFIAARGSTVEERAVAIGVVLAGEALRRVFGMKRRVALGPSS